MTWPQSTQQCFTSTGLPPLKNIVPPALSTTSEGWGEAESGALPVLAEQPCRTSSAGTGCRYLCAVQLRGGCGGVACGRTGRSSVFKRSKPEADSSTTGETAGANNIESATTPREK